MTPAESQQRYADAMHRREVLLARWVELGEPLLAEGGATGKALVPHPLVRMLSEADQLCDRLGKTVRVRDVGRPVGATSAPDRDEPPRITLREAS